MANALNKGVVRLAAKVTANNPLHLHVHRRTFRACLFVFLAVLVCRAMMFVSCPTDVIRELENRVEEEAKDLLTQVCGVLERAQR